MAMSVKILVSGAALASLAGLTACSAGAGADGAVCDVLTSDTALASTVFTAAVPGLTDSDRIEAQNDLLRQIDTPPSGLEDEWATWMDYREFAEENFDSNAGEVVSKFEDADVSDAADALTKFYTGTCLA